MKRNVLTLLLTSLLVVSAWASNTKVNGIYYDFDDARQAAIVTYRGGSYSAYENEYEGNVVIPASVKHNGRIYDVKEIGLLAFSGCSTLTGIELPASIEKINGWAFDGCTSLENIVLREGLESIGSYAFSNNKKLEAVSLPNSLSNLGAYSFQECDNLRSVTIGEGIRSLENNVFYGCPNIREISLRSIVPPAYSPSIFHEQALAANVIVPCEADAAYKASAWNRFASIKSDLVWKLDVVSQNDAQGSVKIVKNNSCRDDFVIFAATPAQGFEFAGWNDGNKDNPRRMKLDADARFEAQFAAVEKPVVEVAKAEPVVEENKAEDKAAVEAAKAEEKRQAELAKAEEKRQAELAKAEEKRQAELAKAEEKRQAELAKAEAKAQREAAKAEAKRQQEEARAAAKAEEAERAAKAQQAREQEQKARKEEQLAKAEAKKAQQQEQQAQQAQPQPTEPKAAPAQKAQAQPKVNALEGSDGKKYAIVARSSNWWIGTVKGSGLYLQGTEAVITANPRKGHHFTRWQDGSVQNPRTVVVTNGAEYKADFATNTCKLDLSVDSAVNGVVVGGGTYLYGDKVTINAVPDEGYKFIKWSDGKFNATRDIKMKEDLSLVASFHPLSYEIVADVNGGRNGNGKVTGAGTYEYNKNVTLTAVPDSGYHFAAWNDNITTNPREFAATKNAHYQASFLPNMYEVKLESDDMSRGSVKGDGQYAFKQQVTIEAVPEEGYSFAQWNDGNTQNPRLVTISGDAKYTASFSVNKYEIKALSANLSKGTVSGSGTYEYKSMPQLEASPLKGYYFVKWNDDVSENPRTITITKNDEYEATFAEKIFRIDAKSDNSSFGKVLGSGSYLYGSNVLLRADAAEGYHFVKWNDDNTDNPRTITVEDDTKLTATFDINTYVLRATVDYIERGVIQGNGKYKYGTVVELHAVPRPGHHFTHWSDGNTENPRKVTMNSDLVYEAQFDLNKYIMKATSANPSQGKAVGSGEYLYNYVATIRAKAEEGYHFDGWSDGNTQTPREITMTQDMNIEAQFSPDIYSITVKSGDVKKGTVSGSGTFEYLMSAQISASPKYGYHFARWNDGITSNPRKVVVNDDATYTATFEPNVYTITVRVNDNKFGLASGTGDYEYNKPAALRAVPAAGYKFAKWSDGNTQNPRNVTVTKTETYEAVFVPIVYTLTLTSCDANKGSVSGTGAYDYQSVVKIQATAKNGYHFAHWSDGSTQNPRNFIIKGNAAYEAVFVANTYNVSVVSEDKNMGDAYGSGAFEYNTSVSISATPAEGYRFSQWSDGSRQNPRAVTVTGDTSYTAIFELDNSGR